MLDKVTRGQKFHPSAAERNAVVDLLRDWRSRQQNQPLTPLAMPSPSATIVTIHNTTSVSLTKGAILGFEKPLGAPGSPEFLHTTLLRGRAPTLADVRRFVVLIEDVAANLVGRAIIDGVAVARIDITADEHRTALATMGETSYLTSASDGPAELLWREPGLGLKWGLVRLGPVLATSAAPIQFARSTGANQTQPVLADGRVGIVEAVPIDDPSAAPDEEAEPILLAVMGRSGPGYSASILDQRFYLPAGSKIAYLPSTAYVGAVGIVVSDHDEYQTFNLYWGTVRDDQGEAETRASGHFAYPTQVRVDVKRRDTGAATSPARTAWVLIPEGAAPQIGDWICFRHQDGLRAGDEDGATTPENWGESIWSDGVFVALNLSSIDGDCAQFGCGVAIGVDLPRDASTGILRMFRGRRADPEAVLSTSNRPDKELQIGVGTLGRWPTGKVSRLLLPGLPYNDWKEPAGPWWTDSSGNPKPNISRTISARRHLVSRLHTTGRNAVELDWSPPGWTGYLYLVATEDGSSTASVRRLALRIYDGLVLGGGMSGSASFSSAFATWDRDNAGALNTDSLTDTDDTTTYDGGCCPKYDSATDVTQGP